MKTIRAFFSAMTALVKGFIKEYKRLNSIANAPAPTKEELEFITSREVAYKDIKKRFDK